jgi:hypothetical protein
MVDPKRDGSDDGSAAFGMSSLLSAALADAEALAAEKERASSLGGASRCSPIVKRPATLPNSRPFAA